MSKRILVFDADHTLYLAETRNAYAEMFGFLSSRLGVPQEKVRQAFKSNLTELLGDPVLSRDPEKRKREYTLSRVLEEIAPEIDGYEKKEIIDKSIRVFFDIVTRDLKPWPGLRELLRDLSEEYTLYISTEEFKPWIEQKLSGAIPEWQGLFRGVITPDETGVMKPSPLYLTLVLEEEKARPEEAVVIGDSWTRDLEEPKKMGATTILVNEALEGQPDYHVTQLPDIRRILL